ncbi:hypothetical protein FB451DRAFT_1467263 [Mycena latifolia]|nr:hypothetical protein FB451DRAFT_1467263 [Mycena latifolia]
MSSVRGSGTSETIYEVEIEWDGTRGTPFCQACDCPEGPETCDVSPSGGFLGKETRISAPEQRLDADKHATVPSSSDVRIPRGRAKHGFYNTVQRTMSEFSLRTTFIVLMSEEGPRELKEAPKCTRKWGPVGAVEMAEREDGRSREDAGADYWRGAHVYSGQKVPRPLLQERRDKCTAEAEAEADEPDKRCDRRHKHLGLWNRKRAPIRRRGELLRNLAEEGNTEEGNSGVGGCMVYR